MINQILNHIPQAVRLSVRRGPDGQIAVRVRADPTARMADPFAGELRAGAEGSSHCEPVGVGEDVVQGAGVAGAVRTSVAVYAEFGAGEEGEGCGGDGGEGC